MTPPPQYRPEHTWDAIAESFDKTRKKPWKQCLDFIETLPKNALVADIGCGNGRHLLPCAQYCRQIIGIDISRKFLQITRKKTREKKLSNVEYLQGNLTALPLKNDSLDAVLYIAAIHTIQGREQRIGSLKEVHRILKPQGIVFISVWSRWQEAYKKYFIKQWFLRKKNDEFGDIIIHWKQQRLNIPRFYHLYSKREFVKDVHRAGFHIERIQCVNLCSRNSPDNFFITARKNA
ncbi:MAG: class I SAM-dependent methyltransferase [Methanobacteriota archaeon]